MNTVMEYKQEQTIRQTEIPLAYINVCVCVRVCACV